MNASRPPAFAKGHGLGNDYIVLDTEALGLPLTPERIRLICDRHRGLGGDGILTPDDPRDGDVGLRIYNPDGSEAEKSGNGIRIFVAYLYQKGLVGTDPFTISIMGGRGRARAQVLPERGTIRVEMGKASFKPGDVPCTLEGPECLGVPLIVDGHSYEVSAVGVGNPHCVLFEDANPGVNLRALGPKVEVHPAFPNRTNVQKARALGPHDCQVEIWERGAGWTAASGSSASAVAAAALGTGRCQSPMTIHMEGGMLAVDVSPEFDVTIEGPAKIVAWGQLGEDLMGELGGV